MVFFIILIANVIVIFSTRKGILNTEQKLPESYYAMVLGTSKKFASGSENLYYKNRMMAVKDLMKKSSPKFIILSGSNPSVYYNEPRDMKLSLSELGIDSLNFIIDSHGDNTFESLKNYSQNYEKDSLIIITQTFHAYRTLLICKQLNINAMVYPAEEVSADITNKPLVREVFARVKALWEFYLFDA
ncbi:MAG: ElyC/SanA/YdcF family protein [Cytophagales bacterium]